MANEPKPQSGNPGTGAKVGGADHTERSGGGAGERQGPAGENTPGSTTRGPSETKPPKKRP